MSAGTPALAQAVDVVVTGARNPTPETPFNPYATITIDDLRTQGDGRGPDGERPIDRGSLSFGDRSFTADQLFYTASRIADSLAIGVSVDPALLGPGERASLSFRNVEGATLTFPAYTAGPRGFTTGTFNYSLGGVSGSVWINFSQATQVPEPGAAGLFALALALLVAARRFGRSAAVRPDRALA
jgi:hypothetical protein